MNDDAINAAIWKTKSPLGIPGTYKFVVQPAADARAKLRTLFENSTWDFKAQGDMAVVLKLPAGWETGFNRDRDLKFAGVLTNEQYTPPGGPPPDKAALVFRLECRGGGMSSQANLTGKLRRGEGENPPLEAELILMGDHFLEARIVTVLEPAPPPAK